jgi:hypothetical protein
VQLVASSKAMLHLMINPEITILTALRLLLMSIAIIVDAVGAMKKGEFAQELDQGGDFALSVRLLHSLLDCNCSIFFGFFFFFFFQLHHFICFFLLDFMHSTTS